MMQTFKLSISLFIILCSGICSANNLDDEVISEPNENKPVSSFQYNGFLLEHGLPVYGHYDLEFTLYDTPNDVNLVSSPIIIKDVNVIDGHYIAELDFGADIFDGKPRWLEVWSKAAGTMDSNYMVDKREKLLPVPYALYAHDSNNPSTVNDEIINHNSLDAADGGPKNSVYVDNSGNVGIGLNNPSAKLDIDGHVRVNGFIMPKGAYSGYVLTTNYLGEGTWKPLPDFSNETGLTGSGTTNYLTKFTGSETLGTSSIFENNGQIGIGTSNPNAKLDVRGGPIKAAGGLIIETRTSDPSNPVTGQIWLRTDF